MVTQRDPLPTLRKPSRVESNQVDQTIPPLPRERATWQVAKRSDRIINIHIYKPVDGTTLTTLSMYTVHSIGGTCPKKHVRENVDEKEKKIFSPFFLRVSPSLSVAFFLGCSDSQPHPRASDTVLNGRGQTRSRSPRYFATFQAFNLARVPLLAIVPMIVGWESLCARFVSSSSAPSFVFTR